MKEIDDDTLKQLEVQKMFVAMEEEKLRRRNAHAIKTHVQTKHPGSKKSDKNKKRSADKRAKASRRINR